MATQCPKCNADNPDTSGYCADCGTKLGTPNDIPVHTKTIETPFPQFSPGTSLAGRYEIIKELGKGGMGEVYLAEDTNLKRQVAIKVLPQEFALDAERLARFEREARLLASLNHPNIATIHGLEKSDGLQFLVMELVEGETLAERLKKGSIPLDDSLEICSQIAEGLESAHEKGIIHRDLKPANVKVTPEGMVEILDFGIAKAFQDQAVDKDPSQAISDVMTEPGVILGTAAYISPEQAKGKAVDKRTDIWSFGCLLYECFTGKRAFQGQSPSETIATILKDDPDWKNLPDQLPSEIRKLLMRCLQKDPVKWPRDIRDIKLEIDESKNRLHEQVVPVETGLETAQRKHYSLGVIIFVVALIAVLAGLFIDRLLLNPIKEKTTSSIVRFSIDLPKDQHVRFFRDNPFIAISPDGKRIAWIGETDQIFTRELSSDEIQKVPGTEDLSPRSPIVFSPDGLKIGFIKDFTIYVVPVEGGVPNPLFGSEDMTDLYTFAWADDGSFVLHFHYKELKRLIPGENRVEPITTLNEENNEVGHGWPHIFPGSKAVLFCVFDGNYQNAHIEVLSLETWERHRVIEDSYHAFYSPTGHLIHVRDGTLYAVPFDVETLEVIGQEVPILSDIQMNTVNNWIPGFSLSNNGTIVYIPAYQGFGEYQLAWINRSNQLEPLPGTDGFVGRPVISY